MQIGRRKFIQAGGAAMFPASVRAAAAPSRPVRIVVGFPAGGPLDIAARTIAPALAERLGQAFVVENRPGASGNLATAHVVRAAPDGDTLLLCGPVNAINATLFEGLDFQFARDIAPVASIARVPLVIELHPSVPARSAAEFLTFARANPGRVRVGFAGVGTPQHIGIELFQMMAGVKLTLVPYAGSAPALVDLLRGEVDAMFDPTPSSMPHLQAGRLIGLATTGPTRADQLPDLPAMTEFVPGYEAGSWFGIGAPRETPPGVIQIFNDVANDALADDAVRARFRDLGAATMPGTPAAFGRFIAAETEKYRRIIEAAGIKRPA